MPGAASPSDHRPRHGQAPSVIQDVLARCNGPGLDLTGIAGGMETVTGAAELAHGALLRDQTSRMSRRPEEGAGLRHRDPAFVETCVRRDRLRMELELLPGGVRGRDTADGPNVAHPIRAHGATVSAVVDEGAKAASRESPLPAAGRRLAG